MNKKTVTLTESDLKNIIKKSVNNILKESFNDKNISNAIEDHGGLKRKEYTTRWSASINANYDLKNSNYEGYLTSNAINELEHTGLIYYLREYLLYTNDGGAVVVSNGNSILDKNTTDWENKVRNRNRQWGEIDSNREKYNRNGEDIYVSPNKFNTIDRRKQIKGMI